MKKRNQILLLFLSVSAIKVMLNLTTKSLLFLDSWTIYHILDAIINHHAILPRGVLDLYYPMSYMPLLPFCEIFGTLFTLKFIYPLISSLAVIPLYYLMSLFVKGRRVFTGTLMIILIDDFLLRSISVTPQGIAIFFLFSGMYFLLKGRKGLFLLSGILTILTHHLTSLILLVFVAAYLIGLMLDYREKNDRKKAPALLVSNLKNVLREKESLAYSALFFLSWFAVSSLADKNIISAYLFIKLLPLAAVAVFFLLTLGFQVKILNSLKSIRLRYLFLASASSTFLLFYYVLKYSTHSFISSYSYMAIFLIPAYILLPMMGMPYLLKSRERVWLVFCVLLMLAFLSIIALRLNCVFDAYRFLPFILVPLVIAINEKSGRLADLLLFVIVFSTASHLALTYDALTYTDKQVEAAQWAKGNLASATIGTDTKMSALFLGLADRPATFEGSYWLFSQDDLAPWIKIFNKYRFTGEPIRYIATSRYMYKTGADISWSAEDYVLSERNDRNYNKVGYVIYNNSDVVIWEVNKTIIENSSELTINNDEKGFVDGILAQFTKNASTVKGGEIIVDSRIAYGSTC